ncbi:MAG: sigma-54-dependent Fis family transcriptional regulator [Candidatus Didemnitutus sp.]|nr:sigma-54-dependent Fis family transcriptional regulator [Candidatus Didemnitutus sp.]
MSTDTPAPTILVIDDDTEVRYSLNRVLSSQRYRVQEAASGEEGVAAVKKQAPDVVLLDNRMTGMTGLETLQHIRAASPRQLVIFMTAYGTAQTAIEAMKYGAYDYVVKPFDPPKLLALVESALRTQADSKSASSYQPVVNSEEHKEGIVGTSPAMQEVFKAIGQFAASDASVMITGESGTGKELVARAIHRHSHRSAKAFVAVNCAAIPENLIESELFGHERGSFTGATAQRLGKFELCDGGTIFLDEIGDMTPTTQTKILRVLQEGEIQRVGGIETIKVNVRVVAATNKNLEVLVKEKKFREDLYYRLNVVRVKLPPLRKRVEDVPQIVDFFLQGLFKAKKTKVRKVSPEALALFCRYRWPGNVRELENVVYRSAVAATGDAILPRDLPDEVRQAGEQEELAADSSTSAPPSAPTETPADSSAGGAESIEELAARLLAAIATANPGNERAALAQLFGDKLPSAETPAPKRRAAKKH